MMTPILFAALLTVATPAIAGDWRSIPRTDGVCMLYNENLECVDAARSFLASSTTDGTRRVTSMACLPYEEAGGLRSPEAHAARLGSKSLWRPFLGQ